MNKTLVNFSYFLLITKKQFNNASKFILDVFIYLIDYDKNIEI